MPLDNLKCNLDIVKGIINGLPDDIKKVMNDKDELIRRSDILVNTCNELYIQVRDVGAYIKRPTGIMAVTSKEAAMYLSSHDYDSPIVLSSASIPGELRNIPMTLSLQLNGAMIIPDGQYMTVKYYHDRDSLPIGSFWNRQAKTIHYQNNICTMPRVIAVYEFDFEKKIENFKKYAKEIIFEMAAAIRAAEKAQRLDTIKEAGKDYVVT